MKFDSMKISVQDRPELSETFVDAVGLSTFDSQHFRLELQVTRLDEPKPPQPPTGRRYPVARLVLTVPAAIDLHNKLGSFVEMMLAKGVVKKEQVVTKTIQ